MGPWPPSLFTRLGFWREFFLTAFCPSHLLRGRARIIFLRAK
jgi:hypothetical protein